MASYKSFEDLPVWSLAIDLAAEVFELTRHDAFKYRGDLVNQIRRSSLPVSNNIAEGFERGTTSDLINFLYIARGSCGETRSMLRFATKLAGMDPVESGIDAAAQHCERVSKQLYGWIESLKHTSIEGQRRLTDQVRGQYAADALREEFREKYNSREADKSIREGRHTQFLKDKFDAMAAIKEAERSAGTNEDAPLCPLCNSRMAKRHDRNGRAFWGCTQYPRCRGSRPYTPRVLRMTSRERECQISDFKSHSSFQPEL